MTATIYAPSTAPGRAAVAVVRVSGPEAHRAAAMLAGRAVVPDRRLRRVRLHDPGSGEPLDDALVVCFADGASFTGEPMAELHLHGGLAVMAGVLDALGRLPDLALAAPGEFARRALSAGRIDLAQAESLADLIDAETAAQRRQALRQLDGALATQAETWRRQLLEIAALFEAAIDFADEALPGDPTSEARVLAGTLRGDLAASLDNADAARSIREGFEVALVGPPNVGKSTLMNAIARSEVALVSPIPGTTRDVIERRCDLGGLCVTFLDMAGLRETDDAIERAGVARAAARARQADLRVFVSDSERSADLALFEPGDLVVRNKADLGGEGVSALTGHGVSDLLRSVAMELGRRSANAGVLTRVRHRRAVESALAELAEAEAAAAVEIAAEHVRRATRALDSLVGAVDVEDVLDEVFARFCLGK